MNRTIITIFFYLSIICDLFSQKSIYTIGEIENIFLDKKVLVERKYPAEKFLAKIGSKIYPGDKIHTSDSSELLLKIYGGSSIYIKGGTLLKINSRWNIAQISGTALYNIKRSHIDSFLEIVTDFTNVYATNAIFSVTAQREKSVFAKKGTLVLQTYKKDYNYYSSDKRCGEAFIKKTDRFRIKENEEVVFMSQNVIKKCGEIPDTLIKDDESIVLYYDRYGDDFVCSAKTGEIDAESDKTEIVKIPGGCLFRLESKKKICDLLSKNNSLFSIYKTAKESIEIRLLPLDERKTAFVQYKCF